MTSKKETMNVKYDVTNVWMTSEGKIIEYLEPNGNTDILNEENTYHKCLTNTYYEDRQEEVLVLDSSLVYHDRFCGCPDEHLYFYSLHLPKGTRVPGASTKITKVLGMGVITQDVDVQNVDEGK